MSVQHDFTEAVDRVIAWSSRDPEDPPPRPIVPRQPPIPWAPHRRRRAPFTWSRLRVALHELGQRR